MDSRNFRMLTLAAAGAAALTVATDAAACEACLPDPNTGGDLCWSGLEFGSGACWGGFGEPCEEEGACTGDQQECYWWEYCDEEDDYWCWGWGCES